MKELLEFSQGRNWRYVCVCLNFKGLVVTEVES